jgi:hypothetical protein
MYHFCTCFDINYLPRAYALYNSLLKCCGSFHLYMLCFDPESAEQITSLKLEHATAIPLTTFEQGDERLTATKSNRTRLEYYYTCGPSLPLYVLKTFSEVNLITYLDADLFFFSDPTPLINEIDGYSIGITFQNFPEYRPAPATGKYTVAWLSFRRDKNGISCLKWWREKCIEWCYERFENGKYADQLYLDEWPQLFQGVKVLENKGANVAPWNLTDYEIYEENDCLMVSGYPLIFFHFHGFKKITRTLYNTNLGLTFRPPSKLLKKKVFKPYIDELNVCSINNNATSSIRVKRLRPQWIQLLRTFARIIIGLVFRQYVFVYKNKIY